ncbi:hypothetical protein [uncultured Gammaproteobacteria bacterium]|nr:hypothetical protein [uncultured Gammaproteobacteria bacterium]CAC9555369.1 hypothetical protein [uncultured Gammaproteobacteria bacterium]
MVDLSRVIVSFIVINQCFVWFLRVDYIANNPSKNLGCLLKKY